MNQLEEVPQRETAEEDEVFNVGRLDINSLIKDPIGSGPSDEAEQEVEILKTKTTEEELIEINENQEEVKEPIDVEETKQEIEEEEHKEEAVEEEVKELVDESEAREEEEKSIHTEGDISEEAQDEEPCCLMTNMPRSEQPDDLTTGNSQRVSTQQISQNSEFSKLMEQVDEEPEQVSNPIAEIPDDENISQASFGRGKEGEAEAYTETFSHENLDNYSQTVRDYWPKAFENKFSLFKERLVARYELIRMEYLKEYEFDLKEAEREKLSHKQF